MFEQNDIFKYAICNVKMREVRLNTLFEYNKSEYEKFKLNDMFELNKMCFSEKYFQVRKQSIVLNLMMVGKGLGPGVGKFYNKIIYAVTLQLLVFFVVEEIFS